MTINYPNPQVKDGMTSANLKFTEVIELNDKPKAIGKATPNQISTLQRTVKFVATDSYDDGPKADLYVIWSFGIDSNGDEIGSAEGTWDDMKEYTYTYAFGEDPGVSADKAPFLILRDKYGAVSAKAIISLAVS